MSFEDDEYWDEEYSVSARTAPDPVIPTRRPVPSGPVDELAARRQRRAGATPPVRRPQAAFDAERPSWLDDPGFVPIDTSAAADADDAGRPGAGAPSSRDDGPYRRPAAPPPQSRGVPATEAAPGVRGRPGPRAAHVVAPEAGGPWSMVPDHAPPAPRRPGPAAGAGEAGAAPYMDADGTLHNLRPIARLEVCGPDPAPHRPADTEFAGKWFAARTPAPAAEPAENAGPAQAAGAPHAMDLAAIRWRLDGATLREVVDDPKALRELGERLDGPLATEADSVRKAGLLSLRAEVYRLLGELGMAAAASRLALAHAESVTDPQATVIAQAELAHVLRLRGDFTEADRLFAKALGTRVPGRVHSVVHENAGRCCFDQGRHMEALDHFARAERLGGADDAELAERIGVCLQAVYIHVLRDGWGPYPRTPRDILGPAQAVPAGPHAVDRPAEQPRTVPPS